MKDLDLFSRNFGIGKSSQEGTKNKRAVIWTRVSTKGQEDNTSLKNQRNTCYQVVAKDGLEVVREFGGKGESARAGALRKEFKKMLQFVRNKSNQIRYILFYDHTRFSREGGKAIFVKEELREKYGIITKSAVLPLDTEDPYADLVDSQQLLFARAENEKRRKRTLQGLADTLRSGKWCGTAPFGYQWDKISGTMQIHPVNGPIVKKAFMWRYRNPNLTVREIRERLKADGLKLSRNHAHRIFHNPIYCGLMANKVLKGEVVQGNHEPIISKEIFLAVNNVFQQKSGQDGTWEQVNEALPLKAFCKCGVCGGSLTGYEVKTKNGKPRKHPIPYYKCKNSCKVNKSARKLNAAFKAQLEQLVVKPELAPLITQELYATLIEANKDSITESKALEKRLAKIEAKQKRLKERFILDDEITREEYNEFSVVLDQQRASILEELDKINHKGSNLMDQVEKVVQKASRLPLLWENGDYHFKQNLQNMVFPEGMVYNKESDQVLTPRVNEAIRLCSLFSQKMDPLNAKNSDAFASEFHRGTHSIKVSNTLVRAYRQIFSLKPDFVKYLREKSFSRKIVCQVP